MSYANSSLPAKELAAYGQCAPKEQENKESEPDKARNMTKF